MIEILDDDGDDLEALEVASFELAKKGRVFEDPYSSNEDVSQPYPNIADMPAEERLRKIRALEFLAMALFAGKCFLYFQVFHRKFHVFFPENLH